VFDSSDYVYIYPFGEGIFSQLLAITLSYSGAFSGMKIVSYMYAAFQQVMPDADVGIDLSKEYAAVKGR
jgi:hypothetical protein